MGFMICFYIFCYIFSLGMLSAFIVICFNLPEGYGLSFLNPNVLYKTGKVNRFGAYFLGVLFSIILLPVAIVYWLYKLCTIGRRQDNEYQES